MVVSFFLQHEIQIVLDFNGGIFGTFIVFFLPTLEVWKARKKFESENKPKNYIPSLPIIVGGLGIIFTVYNMYNIIDKNFIQKN